MSYIVPYNINILDHDIDRLKQKLALSDFPNGATESTRTSWDQGPPVGEIQRLALVWQNQYSWRKAEAELNTFPQFTAPIEVESLKQTYDIHFLHKKSRHEDAIPLLFLHGWPGSFIEVTKMVHDLVQGDVDGPAFHVVAPSLVDFGFSSCSTKGFRFEHHAEVYHKLMKSLGYERYVVQSGDIGSLVARFMAKKYASSGFAAYHTNTPSPTEPTQETNIDLYERLQSTPLTEHEEGCLARAGSFMKEGFGYYKIQSTKPTTIGFSLRDSPVGLLAWIYEKMHDWSDGYPWTDEEILTWVSIHYFSIPGPAAPSNAYYAMEHDEVPVFVAATGYIDVPLGITRFHNDLVLMPKLWNHTLGPIVYEGEYERGGHFGAWERPDAIVQDLRCMFAPGRSLHRLFRP